MVVDFQQSKAAKSLSPQRILITHTDLDGLGCAILFAKVFPELQIIYAEPLTVDDTATSMRTLNPKAHIIITDLSVSRETALYLQTGPVDLIDHHKTATFLTSEFPWALVDTTVAATMLVYNMLSVTHHLDDYYELVKMVDNYDTWGHGTQPEEESKQLSRLVYLLGRDRFLRRFLTQSSTELSPTEQAILHLDDERKNEYLQRSLEIATPLQDLTGNKYFLLAADQYQSETGNYILENTDAEYVLMINFREDKVGLRSKGKVDVSEIAKALGGGGHKRAAGFPLTDSTYKYFVQGV